MTDQDKCRVIAEWLGIAWHDGPLEGKLCSCGNMWLQCTEENTDYLNTNESFSLLDELVKRGKESYYLVSRFDGDRYVWCCVPWHVIIIEGITTIPDSQFNESKSRAIVESLLALIEKEKEK